MSNYVRVNNFTAKDSLSSGDSNKKILGVDVDAELNAIVTAVATKLDKSGGTMTGALTLPGAPSVALHAATKAYVDAVSGATYFPSGTVMVFYQANAPTGWTTDTLSGTCMLRVVAAGSGGGALAGTDNPISFASSHQHSVSGTSNAGSAHNHTVSIANESAHTHAVNYSVGTGFSLAQVDTPSGTVSAGSAHSHTNTVANESSHTHSFSATSGSAGATWSPRYINVVIGTKV